MFERAIDGRGAIKTSGVQTESRLIGTEMGGQGTVEQDVVFGGVHWKKRWTIAGSAGSIDDHWGLQVFVFAGPGENARQHPRGRGVIKGSERRGTPQVALDQDKQLRRSDGVAAQSKEIIVWPNLMDIQYPLPERKHRPEQWRLRYCGVYRRI